MADLSLLERKAAQLSAKLREDARTDRSRALAETLRGEAERLAMHVTADDRIGESHLAKLLGWNAGTLANRRRSGQAPPHYAVAIAGHRVTYRIADVADWIESRRDAAA